MKNSFKLGAAAFAVAAAFCSTAHAAGFQLTEQSAGAMGRAYAGVGVDGTDLSGVYYNPATMVLHPGTQFQAGFVGIALDLQFEGSGEGEGVTENGRYKPQAIPHGFITHQISDDMWVGLGMTVPFGMGTEYDDDWRYGNRGISATVLTFDFNPNVAWKLSEKFSVGAGVSLQYASADLKMREDFSGGVASADGEIDADSWAWGFNVGAMWSPMETLRFGLSYRSAIHHNAEGDFTLDNGKLDGNKVSGDDLIGIGTADPDNPNADLIQLGSLLNMRNFDGRATVNTPAWAMFNAAWDVNDLMSLYATFRWTDWSSFDELEVTTSLPGVGTTVTNKWQDTYLFTLGADFRMNDWWTFRTGVGYETSPIDKAQYRTTIIPDSERLWLAAGSSFKVADNMQLDVSAAWLHGLGESDVTASETDKTKVGEFDKLDAYLIGVQLQYKF